jgi:heat shock protein HslJ
MLRYFLLLLPLISPGCNPPRQAASTQYVKPDTPLGQAAADSTRTLPLKSNWELQSINGQLFSEARLTGNTPTLNLDLETGKANGNAGCNRYNMPVKPDGNKLVFGHMMLSKMSCQAMGLENAFVNALMNRPVRYEYKPGQLLITDDLRNVLVFKAR